MYIRTSFASIQKRDFALAIPLWPLEAMLSPQPYRWVVVEGIAEEERLVGLHGYSQSLL